MASVTEPSQPQSASEEQLVDRQIRRTRRALKIVDFTAGLITLAIGVLGFLLVTAICEHWIIPGGWSSTARSFLFGLLLVGTAVYSWRTFWPLLQQVINPTYAAQAIEQSSPSLKNSLLNLLLLRTQKQQMSRQVYQAIELQAAQRLAQVPIDSVVDRSAIIRLGYILVALTAVCALYRFLSPKDLIASAGRVLIPWSEIAIPSRVEILQITPGDTQIARGERLSISAEVLGLAADEPVRLFYSTADQQIVGQELPMSTAVQGGSRFSCQVPGRVGARGSHGVEQNFSYWVVAGDAQSPHYQVTVFARPTLVVNKLRYDYPAYTGYPSRTTEHTGDIRAVEGTRVTLFAEANQSIQSAHVDFEADGSRDLLMSATGQQASITFPLELREDHRTPRHPSYVLRYLTTAGKPNEQPPKYKIDVQPDYSPEIQLLLPEEPLLEVPLNQEVNFELEARDPDFALSQVVLIGKRGEEQLVQEELLKSNHTGRFAGKLRKTPAEMGLQPGDLLEYWGVAADNRRPEANIAYSAHRKLRIVGPWQGDAQQEQPQPGEGGQPSGEGGPSQEGEGGQEGQAGGGQESGTGGEGEQEGEGQAGQEGGEAGENNQSQTGQGGNDQAGESEPDSSNNSPNGSGGNSPSDDSSDSSQADSNPSDDPREGEGGNGESSKVSADGDDDGSAFEKMAKHFDEQEGQTGEGSHEQGAEQSSGTPNESQADKRAAGGNPDNDQTSNQGDSDPSNSADGAVQEEQPSAGQQGTQQDRPSADQGAQGDPAAGEEQQAGADNQQQEGQPSENQSPDSKMSPEQGDAGAGDSGGQEQGTPNPSEGKKPQDKQGDSATSESQENTPSKSRDSSESDSESSQGGDRSGGGKEGTGQQANESGKGGAGESEAADEGAGQASEQGDGETGERPGDQQQADGKTGESSGDQPGNGSQQNPQAGQQPGEAQPGGNDANQGDANQGKNGQPGSKPGEAAPSNPSQQQPSKGQQQPPNQADAASEQSPPGSPAGDPTGGTGSNTSSPPPSGSVPEGDQANLDYARQKTDLILNKLDEQLKKQTVDQNLLDKLGWTQDELRRFVNRWKNLKTEADQPGATGADEAFSDALRSLGLKRQGRTQFNSKLKQDKLRDLRDAYRSKVPLEYQEQIRSYLRGTTQAQPTETKTSRP